MTRKILAALDGTQTSESVLPYVEALLETADADITLVTAVPMGSTRKLGPARARLEEAAERLRKKGAFVDVEVAVGAPAAAIVNLAVQGRYDLIALCTKGKTGLKRLLLGSVAEEVLQRSPVPVLVVHPLPPKAAPRVFGRIAVALDGSHRSASILPHVRELALAARAKVAFVTAISPYKKEDLPVEVAGANLFRDQKALQNAGLEVDLAILYGDPATEILAFAGNNHADLLALSTHGRTGLNRLRYGSVAQEILRKSRIPLLVLRTAAQARTRTTHSGAVRARQRALRLAKEAGAPHPGPYTH